MKLSYKKDLSFALRSKLFERNIFMKKILPVALVLIATFALANDQTSLSTKSATPNYVGKQINSIQYLPPIPVPEPEPIPVPWPWPGPVCLSCPPFPLDRVDQEILPVDELQIQELQIQERNLLR